MRFAKFLGVMLVALSAQAAYAQTQPENAISHDKERPEAVHIFPNPALDYLHVKVEHVPAAEVKLSVHNILGNEMQIETEIMDEQTLRVRVKDFATGYYLLSIKHEKAGMMNIVKKFVKR